MSHAPLRADHVGSLLRPASLAQARAAWREGQLEAAALAVAEDLAITEAVARQESLGLQAVTDGEFRRDWRHLDFLRQLDGVQLVQPQGPKFGVAGVSEQPPMATVTGKLGCSRPIMTDHFAFLKAATTQVAKFTMPSPSMQHLRGGRAALRGQSMATLGTPGLLADQPSGSRHDPDQA